MNAFISFSISDCPKSQSWAARERRCTQQQCKTGKTAALLLFTKQAKIKANLLVLLDHNCYSSYQFGFWLEVFYVDFKSWFTWHKTHKNQSVCIMYLSLYTVCFMCHPSNREEEKHMAVILCIISSNCFLCYSSLVSDETPSLTFCWQNQCFTELLKV